MTVVNVVQPVYLVIVDRETLPVAYESVCDSMGLKSIDGGFGMILALVDGGHRTTLVAQNPQIVRDLAELPEKERDGTAFPEGGFPLIHPEWVDVPKSAIIARHGKLAVIGPADYTLGPRFPIHPILYYRDGVEAGATYANGPELPGWIADLDRAGWVVDDRVALDPHGPVVRRGARLAERLCAFTTPVPADYHQIAASITEAADALNQLAEAGEARTSPAYIAAAAAMADALFDHDKFPADRRPV